MDHTYVIADLHGRWDLYIFALRDIYHHIKSQKKSSRGTIVILGDFVDRGPHSAQIIESMRELEADFAHAVDEQVKLVILTGNHEDMMVETLTFYTGRPQLMDWWQGNGGGETLESYRMLRKDHNADVLWLKDLKTFYEDKHRIYVHAGVDPLKKMEKQERDTLLWKLYNNNTDVGHYPTNKHVVHGHHQFVKGPRLYSNRTNLDTLAWASGRLVVGVFQDEKSGGPVELLEVKGPRHPSFSEKQQREWE